MITSIRVTPEMKSLLDEVARYRNRSVSFILRAVARGIVRRRTVSPIEVPEPYYKSGEVIVPCKELTVSVPMEEFRRVLYIRCREELMKPPEKPVPAFSAVAGRDYIIGPVD